MKPSDVLVCEAKPLSFLQRFYLVEIVKGLAVTLRHFLGNLFFRKYTVTIEWPEVKREYSDRLRGRHVILTRRRRLAALRRLLHVRDGLPGRLHPHRGGGGPDLHRRVGEEAEGLHHRPAALRVLRVLRRRLPQGGDHHDPPPRDGVRQSRDEAVIGLDTLLVTGPVEKLDLGYRPYYGKTSPPIRLPIPVKAATTL